MSSVKRAQRKKEKCENTHFFAQRKKGRPLLDDLSKLLSSRFVLLSSEFRAHLVLQFAQRGSARALAKEKERKKTAWRKVKTET